MAGIRMPKLGIFFEDGAEWTQVGSHGFEVRIEDIKDKTSIRSEM